LKPIPSPSSPVEGQEEQRAAEAPEFEHAAALEQEAISPPSAPAEAREERPAPLVTSEALQEALGRLKPIPSPSSPVEEQEEQRAAEAPEFEHAAAPEPEVVPPSPPAEVQAAQATVVDSVSHVERPSAAEAANQFGVTLRKVETKETNLPFAQHVPAAQAAEAPAASARVLAAQAMQAKGTGRTEEASVTRRLDLLSSKPLQRGAAEAPVGPVPRVERPVGAQRAAAPPPPPPPAALRAPAAVPTVRTGAETLDAARSGLRKVETKETNLPLARHAPAVQAAEAPLHKPELKRAKEAPVSGPKPLLPAKLPAKKAAEAPVHKQTSPILPKPPVKRAAEVPVHHAAQHHEK
jgi:hypothetical protein